ncbi:MAG: transcription elongation factor GreA [Pelagibacteraceae bacterium]|jgi:transcription elongation factor GreA|nr:transcription elongation factor GreA [Pelagibacteraceae bacterium]MBT3901341.1 transcription elongation factor GreA [Pelagibacteraceae bacterium]MBT4645573.1 transcription elongation factor GreA [Pelagibacteraceae bacterium]MBT5214665.1 transcription elongation factor GreA [Pelagibacteraceae bacterium]
MNKIPMTASGYENLQIELKKLLNEDRPNIIAAIAEARSHGDLSENAEYQYAKEQQSLIEGKIADLESAISRVEIIDVKSITGDEIKFGATIEIEDSDSGELSKYQIVGEYESDIKNNKLSVSSPLARGLINKSVDDVVEINSPKGAKSYTIISVKYI